MDVSNTLYLISEVEAKDGDEDSLSTFKEGANVTNIFPHFYTIVLFCYYFARYRTHRQIFPQVLSPKPFTSTVGLLNVHFCSVWHGQIVTGRSWVRIHLPPIFSRQP